MLALRLKIAFSCPFWGNGFGAYFPQMASSVILTPIRHLLARKHVVWAIKRMRQCRGLTCVEDQEKDKASPSPNRSTPKFACRVTSRTWSRVPNLRMKFWRVAIIQGFEISILLLIFEWPSQQCSATVLPVTIVIITMKLSYIWNFIHSFTVSSLDLFC